MDLFKMDKPNRVRFRAMLESLDTNMSALLP